MIYKNSIRTSQETPHLQTKTSQLMLFGKQSLYIVRIIRNKHKLCGENVGSLNVKAGGIYSNHYALKS
jgi:hypothetical protein